MELPSFMLKGSIKGWAQNVFAQPPTFGTESWKPSNFLKNSTSRDLMELLNFMLEGSIRGQT